jgi:VIT1/CCC1 family predicted Fe2+/Mn2+ transporter
MDEEKIKHNILVKDFVYGSIDGVITTFAVVSGVAGAALSPTIILILGFANLFADGFSMSVGNYLGYKSEKELYNKEKKREEHEVKTIPKEEKKEIRNIYKKKGFRGSLLDKVVDKITSNKKVWVDTMMKEELGLFVELVNPVKSAIITFLSFVLMGLIPLIGFLISRFFPLFINYAFLFSVFITLVSLFMIGVIKGRIVEGNLLFSGLQTMLIGGGAASIAYFLGYFLQILV